MKIYLFSSTLKSFFAFGMRSQARKYSSTKNLPLVKVCRPLGARMGWGNEVLNECIPFTAELITSKRRAFEQIAVSYFPRKRISLEREEEDCRCGSVSNISDLTGRKVEDGWLEIILPFADHEDLRESFARADNKTVRYGMLFEMLDALAADVAYRHCGEGAAVHTIVTAAVDGVRASASIDIDNDLKLQGYVTFVGRSSIEVLFQFYPTFSNT